jgi:transmembrane sensor
MITDGIYNEAAAWLIGQQDDAFDWDGFTLWLEADPRNRAAFDEIALVNADLDDHAMTLADVEATRETLAANDPEPPRWRRWTGLGGGALAAGLALVLALQPTAREIPLKDYRSAPGKSIEVALADGGKVLLAPESHLAVRGQQIAIEGTGYFDVPHKPGRTLTVNAGDFKVTDIGTRFTVGNEADGVSVDVEEGELSVTSGRLRLPIDLTTGRGMRVDPSSGTVRLVKVEPQRVAGWRTGKLQFDQAPLALVARDISRYSGKKVTVDQAIAGQQFSGVIRIDEGAAPARTLAQILSLDVQEVDGGLRLRARRR